jgi:hypothetical protein
VSVADRCAAQTRKEAASPPLTVDQRAAAPGLGDTTPRGYGRPSGVKAAAHRLRRRPLPGAALSAGDHWAPQTEIQAILSLPARGAAHPMPRCPAPPVDVRDEMNWRSTDRRNRKNTRNH